MFERRSDVGGLWHYDANPGPFTPHYGRPDLPHTTGFASWKGQKYPSSAMYEDLLTNLPCDIMAYRDAPFPEQVPLFPKRATVLSYLKAFAKSEGVLPYIRFKTDVVNVVRVAHDAASGSSKWRVSSRVADVPESEAALTHELFDCVVAAQGRCNVPHIPVVPGIEHFRGRQTHSAWYRFPEGFRGQRVLVVGNNSSGGDVARELSGGIKRDFPGAHEWCEEAATEPPQTGVTVYQCYRHPEAPPPVDYDPRDAASPAWCRRIHVVSAIDHVETDGTIRLESGDALRDIDVIVWATGFLHDMRFLDAGVAPFDTHPVLPRDGSEAIAVAPAIGAATSVQNLDDWFLFYEHDRSLCFLGLLNRIVPFPFTQTQARAVAHVWLGNMAPLPPVRSDLSPADPARWQPQERRERSGEPRVSADLTLGQPAESAYLDALIGCLPGAHGARRPPSEAAYLAKHDALGNGAHGTEGWYQTAQWRRDRRQSGKALRRELLGY